jgi:hypothetical protein
LTFSKSFLNQFHFGPAFPGIYKPSNSPDLHELPGPSFKNYHHQSEGTPRSVITAIVAVYEEKGVCEYCHDSHQKLKEIIPKYKPDKK